MESLLRKNILDINPYIPGRSKFDASIQNKAIRKIQLSSNTNIIGVSPLVVDSINEHLTEIQHYPDPNANELKLKLAENLNLDKSNFLIGNGSAELIDLINHTFIENGNEVLTSYPTFPKYHISARLFNSSIQMVRLDQSNHDVYGLINSVNKNTKVIYVDNPNNPTGTALEKRNLEYLIRNVPQRVILVIDEAYHEFNDPENKLDYRIYTKERNILFLRSFSKAYGIAGLRVGYMIGNSNTIRDVNRVREVFNVNRMGLVAAVAALEDHKHLTKNLEITRIEKEYLKKNLEKLGFSFANSKANFLFINTERDINLVDKYLLDNGIIVRPVTLNEDKNGYIRVTVGTPEENKIFIKIMSQVKQRIPKLTLN